MDAWTLQGRVLAEGAPAADVWLDLAQYASPDLKPEARLRANSDREGRFRFEGLRPLLTVLNAHLPGHLNEVLTFEAPTLDPVVVRLERGASVRAFVEGAWPPGKTSIAFEMTSKRGTWGGRLSMETEMSPSDVLEGIQSGIVIDGLPPGLYRASSGDPDVERVEPEEIRLDPKADRVLTLRLRPR